MLLVISRFWQISYVTPRIGSTTICYWRKLQMRKFDRDATVQPVHHTSQPSPMLQVMTYHSVCVVVVTNSSEAYFK